MNDTSFFNCIMVRFKNRYILFEVLWEEAYHVPKDMTASMLHQALKQWIELYYGNMGLAALAHSLTGNKMSFNFTFEFKN